MKYRRAFAALVVTTSVVAACGGDDESSSSETGPTDSSASAPTVATSGSSESSPTEATSGSSESSPTGETSSSSGGTEAAEPSAEVETIKIGLVLEMSGPYAGIGEPTLEAMEIAVAEVNGTDGFEVDGARYKFELVVEDNESETAAAVAAATSLTEDQGIKFLFGPTISSLAPSMAQLVASKEVIMISPANALQELLENGGAEGQYSRLFRTNWGIERKASNFGIGFLTAYPEAKTVALIAPDDGTGRTTSDALVAGLEGSDVEVVSQDFYPATSTDFQTLLTKVKSENPDVVVICCSAAQVTGLARQANELGITADLYYNNQPISLAMHDALDGPNNVDIAVVYEPAVLESLPDGTVLSNRPGTQRYADALEESGAGVSQAAGVGLYYMDGVLMLAAAMTEAGTATDVDAIASALTQVSVDGFVGEVTFSEGHNWDVEGDMCKVVAGSSEPECQTLPRSPD